MVIIEEPTPNFDLAQAALAALSRAGLHAAEDAPSRKRNESASQSNSKHSA